jgi:hypothetical protein
MKEEPRVLTKEELAIWLGDHKDITAEFLTRVGWKDILAKNDLPVEEDMVRTAVGWKHTQVDSTRNIDVAVEAFCNQPHLSAEKDFRRVLVEYCPDMIAVTMYQKADGQPPLMIATL